MDRHTASKYTAIQSNMFNLSIKLQIASNSWDSTSEINTFKWSIIVHVSCKHTRNNYNNHKHHEKDWIKPTKWTQLWLIFSKIMKIMRRMKMISLDPQHAHKCIILVVLAKSCTMIPNYTYLVWYYIWCYIILVELNWFVLWSWWRDARVSLTGL